MYGGIFLGHFVSRVCPLGHLFGGLGGFERLQGCNSGGSGGSEVFFGGGCFTPIRFYHEWRWVSHHLNVPDSKRLLTLPRIHLCL